MVHKYPHFTRALNCEQCQYWRSSTNNSKHFEVYIQFQQTVSYISVNIPFQQKYCKFDSSPVQVFFGITLENWRLLLNHLHQCFRLGNAFIYLTLCLSESFYFYLQFCFNCAFGTVISRCDWFSFYVYISLPQTLEQNVKINIHLY